MNLILLQQAEAEAAAEDGSLLLPAGDRRAQHIVSVLKPEPDATVRVGILNGNVGRAGVCLAGDGSVRLLFDGEVAAAGGGSGAGGPSGFPGPLAVSLSASPPEPPHIELLLAMPRPKVMMRLWSWLAQLGVRRIMLVNAYRVEKPYFSSHALDPSKYTQELLEGLEQAVGTRMPEVRIEKRLKPFVEDDLDVLCPPSSGPLRLICHPGEGGKRIAEAVQMAYTGSPAEAHRGVLLAIGPEGGWIDYELQLFAARGFQQVVFGERVLSTDVAVISLLSLAADALNASMSKTVAASLRPGASAGTAAAPSSDCGEAAKGVGAEPHSDASATRLVEH